MSLNPYPCPLHHQQHDSLHCQQFQNIPTSRSDNAYVLLQRLLEYIVPTQVHIMKEGQIVQTGGLELVDQLEAGGYAALKSTG